MPTDAPCEQSSRAPIVTPPTIISKKADEAEVDVDIVCVPKIQPHSRKEVTSPTGEVSRQEMLDVKRARLRRLLERETIELENSLRDLGYAFIPTQP